MSMNDIPVPDLQLSTSSESGRPLEVTVGLVPASKTSKPRQPKPVTARKQYSSCDACRLRKVKCIREDGSDACKSCCAKNISCSNAFAAECSTGKGIRIEQARQQYGALVQARPPSSESSMKASIMSSAALHALIDIYGRNFGEVLPSIDLPRIDAVCKSSHYDLGRLDILDQLLCLSMSAAAALATDCNTPSPETSSLVLFDPQGTSRDLRSQAVKALDEHGLLRKPSPKTLQILRLLCLLHSGDSAKSLKRSADYRAFERAMVDHARILVETGELVEPHVSIFFWGTILPDSLACAVSGQSPSFTEDDIRNFASFVDYSTEGIISMINEIDSQTADTGSGLLFAAICRILRQHYTEVTSGYARRRGTLNLAVLQDVLPEIVRLESLQAIYETKLTSVFGSDWPDHLQFWLRIIRHLYDHILVLNLNEIEAALSLGTGSATYLEQVSELYDRLSWACLERLVENGGKRVPNHWRATVGSIDGLVSSLNVLRLKRLLKLVTKDALMSGAARWSADDLSHSLKNYLAFVEHLGKTVPSVREQYANLSEDVVAFCESSAQPSAAVIDASLDLIDWQTYGSTSMASSIAAQSQSATPSLGGSQQSTPETVQAWPESSTADPTIAGKLEDLDAFLSYLQNDALQHL